MFYVLSVALGGALGAVARYGLSTWLYNPEQRIPWGTLTANVVGSFLMGVLFVVILERAKLPPEMRLFLMTGFLGAFTTFSAFSLESVALIHEGHVMAAIFYVILSITLCIAALAVAMWFTRLL